MQASLALPSVSAFPSNTGISLPGVGTLPTNLNAIPQSNVLAPSMNPGFTLPSVSNVLPSVNNGFTPTQNPGVAAFPGFSQSAQNPSFAPSQSAFPGLNPYPQGGFAPNNQSITVGSMQPQGQDFQSLQARFHQNPTKNPEKNNSTITIGKKTYNDLAKKYGPPPAHVLAALNGGQQQFGAPQQQFGAPQQQFGAPQQQFGAPQQQFSTQPPSVTMQPDVLSQLMAQMSQMATQISQLSAQVSALTPPPVVVAQSYVLVLSATDMFMIPRSEATNQLIESAIALEESILSLEDNRETINDFTENAASYRVERPIRRANVTDVVTIS